MHHYNTYKEVALVMELGVNGLGTIRSLSLDKRIKIIGLGSIKSIGQHSRYLSDVYLLPSDELEVAFLELSKINERYEKVIPFPTGTDYWVNVLWSFKDKLSKFVIDYNEFVPLLMRKDYQHKLASKLGIPFAETKVLSDIDDLELLRQLTFPVVVKPITRNTKRELFRIRKYDSFDRLSRDISGYLGEHTFLVTRFIDGPDTNLYTFGSYSKSGKVLMEFTGRKLTRLFPDDEELARLSEVFTERWRRFEFADDSLWEELTRQGWRVLRRLFGPDAY